MAAYSHRVRKTQVHLFLFALLWAAAAQAAISAPYHAQGAAQAAGAADKSTVPQRVALGPRRTKEDPFAGGHLAVDPNFPQTRLMATRLHGLWRSADAGASWQQVRTFPAMPLNRIGLSLVLFDKSSGVPGLQTPVIFVGVADPVINLLRSTDAGQTWKPVVGGPVGMYPVRGVFAADGTLHLSYTNWKGRVAVWTLNPRTGAWRAAAQ